MFGRTLIRHLAQKGNQGFTDNLDCLEYALKAVRDRLPSEHAEITQAMKAMLQAGQGQRRSRHPARDRAVGVPAPL